MIVVMAGMCFVPPSFYTCKQKTLYIIADSTTKITAITI